MWKSPQERNRSAKAGETENAAIYSDEASAT